MSPCFLYSQIIRKQNILTISDIFTICTNLGWLSWTSSSWVSYFLRRNLIFYFRRKQNVAIVYTYISSSTPILQGRLVANQLQFATVGFSRSEQFLTTFHKQQLQLQLQRTTLFQQRKSATYWKNCRTIAFPYFSNLSWVTSYEVTSVTSVSSQSRSANVNKNMIIKL